MSIASILTVSMVSMLAVMMAVVTFIEVRRERSDFHIKAERRSLSLAAGVNDILANYLYYTRIDELSDISVALQSDADIGYVNIFLPNGRLIVAIGEDGSRAKYPSQTSVSQPDLDAIHKGEPVFRFEGDYLHSTIPIRIGPTVIGAIQFGFVEAPLQADIDAIIWQQIWQGLIIMALGVGLIYAITRRVTRPLQELATAAAKIGSGNLDETVPVKGGKESVLLGGSLESMRLQLKESYSGLEAKVAERTQEISEANRELERRAIALKATNQDLETAQDGLVRAEKMAVIGQLAGGVAHDLRNPLGAIRNASYLLKKWLLSHGSIDADPKIGKYIEVIDHEVDKSNRTITELLDFAKMENAVLRETSVKKEMEEAFETWVKDDGVTLVIDVHPDLFPVMADGGQLQRVFLNLANNAQQAMPGGGRLTVTAKNVDRRVKITFSDTGEGISQEDIGKIFDPLYTTRVEGTGLGLSVCREIVFQHNGAISARQNQQPSGGAVFEVMIPAITARREAPGDSQVTPGDSMGAR